MQVRNRVLHFTLFLWEIALIDTNFNYKFSYLWSKVEGHKTQVLNPPFVAFEKQTPDSKSRVFCLKTWNWLYIWLFYLVPRNIIGSLHMADSWAARYGRISMNINVSSWPPPCHVKKALHWNISVTSTGRKSWGSQNCFPGLNCNETLSKSRKFQPREHCVWSREYGTRNAISFAEGQVATDRQDYNWVWPDFFNVELHAYHCPWT